MPNLYLQHYCPSPNHNHNLHRINMKYCLLHFSIFEIFFLFFWFNSHYIKLINLPSFCFYLKDAKFNFLVRHF